MTMYNLIADFTINGIYLDPEAPPEENIPGTLSPCLKLSGTQLQTYLHPTPELPQRFI
jgi:hypothetical protein